MRKNAGGEKEKCDSVAYIGENLQKDKTSFIWSDKKSTTAAATAEMKEEKKTVEELICTWTYYLAIHLSIYEFDVTRCVCVCDACFCACLIEL